MHLYVNAHEQFPPHQLKAADNSRDRWFNRFFEDVTRTYEVMQDPLVPDRGPSRNAAYGYNYKYLGSARDNTDSGNPSRPYERYPVRPAKIEAPSTTIAFGTSDGTGLNEPYEKLQPSDPSSALPQGQRVLLVGNHGYTLDPTFIPTWSVNQAEPFSDGNYASYLARRYFGRASICWVDGHISVVDPAAMYIDNSFWNGYGQEDPRDSHVATKMQSNPRY
jgi:hypothetical protein